MDFSLKMHQIQFRPRPRWRAHCAPKTLDGFWEKGMEGEEKRKESRKEDRMGLGRGSRGVDGGER